MPFRYIAVRFWNDLPPEIPFEDVIVELTPEARLAWRLSGNLPQINTRSDRRIAKVLWRRKQVGRWIDVSEMYALLEKLNHEAPL